MVSGITPSQCPILILAGGRGSRLSEETNITPKPMIEIGGIPILLHIMKYYYSFGFNDFVICAGYLSWKIKEYFLNYRFNQNSLYMDCRQYDYATARPMESNQEKWRVRIFDTGINTPTGVRILHALNEMESCSHFGVTYGDGLTNVDLKKEFEYHLWHENIGTVLGVHSPSRFGQLKVTDHHVEEFLEKPNNLINGGFFFFKREFMQYLQNKNISLEDAVEKISNEKKLCAFIHQGFWHPMDTMKDKMELQKMWDQGIAPWTVK